MNRLGRARVPFVWGIDYEGVRGFLITEPEKCRELLWEVRGRGNAKEIAPDGTAPCIGIVSPPSRQKYEEAFSVVMEGLMRGDSFLANLTMPTTVRCDSALRDIFLYARAPYKLLIDDSFVCFSPEPFVRIEDGRISTFPMKGTADGSDPDAERRLLDDYKEICEHYTIVDLMRNDLNSVAENVRVERFRYVERISTPAREIIQTSSEISGRLPKGCEFDFGNIILPLLPAGSITGAPKEATVRIIGDAEKSPRGWYTGVFGFFDGVSMDTAVMIRCLQRGDDGRLYFHSGGGVTVNSVCGEEYEEVITKVCLAR